MNCPSAIVDSCIGQTRTMTGLSDVLIENEFKLISGEIVTVGTFLITTFLTTGAQSMTMNMQKGLNALRCAFVSGFVNTWMLMASLYFAARQFG